MSRKASLAFAAALALLVGIAPAAATPSKKAFKVRSTLDGKTTLPHRIQWVARPSAATTEVRFLIDGQVKWIEQNPPFSYSDDGGYLVTSWLTPGLHRFTIRATSSDGRTARDTVTARVPPTPDPPAALAGTWERLVDTTSLPPSTHAPSGMYSLTFEKRWIQSPNPGAYVKGTDPDASINTGAGWIFDYDWTPGPAQFRVQGAVTFRVFHDDPNGDAEGGSRCSMGGPGADYSWSVSGNMLTLTPIGEDRCRERGFIWTGQWTRVD